MSRLDNGDGRSKIVGMTYDNLKKDSRTVEQLQRKPFAEHDALRSFAPIALGDLQELLSNEAYQLTDIADETNQPLLKESAERFRLLARKLQQFNPELISESVSM